MNVAQLIAHFDRISEAPDAIARLRRFILDLAVRGKLVEQDPNDEPASELLKRIQAEKARLAKEAKTKQSKRLLITDEDKVLYKIPANWKWVPLGETVNNHLGGGTPAKDNLSYWDGDIPWASVKDVGKDKYINETIDRITEAGLADSSSNLIPPGNLIVVTRMGLGKVSINRIPIAINQDLRALSLSSLAAIHYHYIFFRTHSFVGTGLTVKGIRVEELLNIASHLADSAPQTHQSLSSTITAARHCWPAWPGKMTSKGPSCSLRQTLPPTSQGKTSSSMEDGLQFEKAELAWCGYRSAVSNSEDSNSDVNSLTARSREEWLLSIASFFKGG